MRASPRVRLALAFAAGFAACPLAFWAVHLRAQGPHRGAAAGPATRDPRLSEVLALTALQFGGIGGGAVADDREPARVVHLVPPVTGRAAKTWEKLQKPITLNLKNETPLEDFLAEVKKSTGGPDGKDKGLQFFVNPVALQEAEKTMTSPVSIALEDVSAATFLKLTLAQLSLKFYVQEDGIVFITNENDEDHVTDPSAKILDEITAVRDDLFQFRRELVMRNGGQDGQSLSDQVVALRRELATLRQEVNSQAGNRRPEPAATPKPAGGLR